jgi:hypothetical protein
VQTLSSSPSPTKNKDEKSQKEFLSFFRETQILNQTEMGSLGNGEAGLGVACW